MLEKKDKMQKEMEKLVSKYGYRAASVRVLIQIRDELKKLNKRARHNGSERNKGLSVTPTDRRVEP